VAGHRHEAFAVCVPGLEGIVAAELRALGVRPGPQERGGVGFRATHRQLYAANRWLRTATRVLVRVASFRAASFAELERRAAAVDWAPWVAPGAGVEWRVSSHASRLYHTGAVAERLARAVGAGGADRWAGRGHPDQSGDEPRPTQLVVVRIDRDRVTVSVDSSGEPLHHRGWRRETAKAPLRPTLAAALALAVGWDGTVALVDPFCGSGTIPIEAALLARGLPPALERAYAFQRWPSFEPGAWASVAGAVRTAVERAEGTIAPAAIVARDRDAGAVAVTARNAERAGVAADLDLAVAAISALHPPPGPPGWVITNPPYGTRLAGGDLRDLYARLGTVLRTKLAGWRVGLLVADRRLAGHTGLALDEALRTTSGGMAVRFLVGDAG